MRHPVRRGTLVFLLKRLPDAFGKLGPDVLPDEGRRFAVEHPPGVRVHIGVAPGGVERDEPIARGLEHPRQRLARLFRLPAPADQLPHQRPDPAVQRVHMGVGIGRHACEPRFEPGDPLLKRILVFRPGPGVTHSRVLTIAHGSAGIFLGGPHYIALVLVDWSSM